MEQEQTGLEFLYFLKNIFEKSLSSPNLRPLPIILCVSSPVVMGMSGPLSLSLPSCRGEDLLCTVPMSRWDSGLPTW